MVKTTQRVKEEERKERCRVYFNKVIRLLSFFFSCILICSSCVPLLVMGLKNKTESGYEERDKITQWIQNKDYASVDAFISGKAESDREKYYRMAAEASLTFEQYDQVRHYAEKTTKKKEYFREAAEKAMMGRGYSIAFDFYGLLGDKSSQIKAADTAMENEIYAEAAYCYTALGEIKKAEESRAKDEIRTKAKDFFEYYETFIDSYLRKRYETGLAVLFGHVAVKPEEILSSDDCIEISKTMDQYIQENKLGFEHVVDLGKIYYKRIMTYTDYSQEAVRWGRQGMANRYNILAYVFNQTHRFTVSIDYFVIQ